MPDVPVNVCIARPASPLPQWAQEEPRWIALNREVGGHPDFFPLTVKAFYVIGLIWAACKSVGILLDGFERPHTTYFPAYAVFASAIDLLGRCVNGSQGTASAGRDITAGFQWLANPDIGSYANVDPNDVFVNTENSSYSIQTLVAFRHFAAHGQARSNRTLPNYDFFILGEMPPKLAAGLESYWSALQSGQEPCNRLARAGVTPYRNKPIFDTLWSFSGGGAGSYPAIYDIFFEFDWRYRPPNYDIGGEELAS